MRNSADTAVLCSLNSCRASGSGNQVRTEPAKNSLVLDDRVSRVEACSFVGPLLSWDARNMLKATDIARDIYPSRSGRYDLILRKFLQARAIESSAR